MKPDTFTEHHLIYKPIRAKNLPPNIETYYMKLLSRVDDKVPEGGVYEPRKQQWAIRLEELPEVTRRPCVSRSVLSANTGTGDVMGFIGAMGYT
jgi:mediator of RNA polymerase II transcription subunit 18